MYRMLHRGHPAHQVQRHRIRQVHQVHQVQKIPNKMIVTTQISLKATGINEPIVSFQ